MMVQVRKPRSLSPRQAAARRGPVDGLLDPDLFKSLADPTRVKLLACLVKCRRPCAVSEIAACCSVDLSVVSRHLAALARAGALESRKEGRTVFYAARHAHLSRTLRALASAIEDCCPANGRAACTGGNCDA